MNFVLSGAVTWQHLSQIFFLVPVNMKNYQAILFAELVSFCWAAWGNSFPAAVDLIWTISSYVEC